LDKTNNRLRRGFSPWRFGQLPNLGDNAAYWALSRLQHTDRTGRGSLDLIFVIRWKESSNRPNTDAKDAPGRLEVMTATRNEMEPVAERRRDGEKQADQPRGSMRRCKRHERGSFRYSASA